ncbi:MAG: hypothetical protein KC713_03040 [Candidatus Omnitrophica bacterium]|nr:hypothetical protein [Candidatus Omnitrophota bacterium]
MHNIYLTFALLILGTVMIGLFRVFYGPTRADRLLAAQLCGTGSVSIFLLLAFALAQDYLLDMALVFAVLTAVSSITFVRLTWTRPTANEGGEERG